MTNQERNKIFLDSISEDAKGVIVNSIATHYGTNVEVITEELTDNDEAEHLLEYMVEPQRSATSMLMQRHNLRGY
jgi:RNA binding exosome subunit